MKNIFGTPCTPRNLQKKQKNPQHSTRHPVGPVVAPSLSGRRMCLRRSACSGCVRPTAACHAALQLTIDISNDPYPWYRPSRTFIKCTFMRHYLYHYVPHYATTIPCFTATVPYHRSIIVIAIIANCLPVIRISKTVPKI